MAAAYVYVIAFKRDKFLMVRHARRSWEMPGGKVEEGETPEMAAAREFFEETGYEAVNLRVLEHEENGIVYLGEVGAKVSSPNVKEIIEVGFFSELPSELSFPLVEYRRMIGSAIRARR